MKGKDKMKNYDFIRDLLENKLNSVTNTILEAVKNSYKQSLYNDVYNLSTEILISIYKDMYSQFDIGFAVVEFCRITNTVSNKNDDYISIFNEILIKQNRNKISQFYNEEAYSDVLLKSLNKKNDPIVGEILRNLRYKYHFSLNELSQKIGIPASTLAMYEQGRRNPSKEKLKTILEFYKNNNID